MADESGGDLRIVGDETVKDKKALADLAIKQRKAWLERHRTLLVHWSAIVVILPLVLFLCYVTITGDPQLQQWATHLLATIGGLAAGALWGAGPDR